MVRRPPRSTRTDTLFPTRRSSDLADSHSTLCLVITGAGEREWVFYTGDENEFVERLSNMPHDDAPYPIRIEYEHDPEWAFYVDRSEEHTSELQSLMRISYAVFCLKNKKQHIHQP